MKSILSELSPETNQKLEIFQEILSILSTISESTVDSSYSSLDSLNIFKNDSFMKFIIRKIVIFCEIHPYQIKLYARLVKLINDRYSNCKDSFIAHLLHRYYFSRENSESSFILFALYCCIQEEIITNNEIVSLFKIIFRQKYQYISCNIIFFMYFSPELKRIDPDFYEELYEYVIQNIITNDEISDSITNFFYKEFQTKLIQNDFQLLKKYRNDSHISENPLFEIIYNDDINKLREYLSNPNKSDNEIIVYSIISPYREIANNLSLISTAAVFSAVNCFKYLLLNGSKVDKISVGMGSLAQDTIVGGSIEIIRLAQQNRIDFSGALTTCAFYFRNEIFEWIFEMQGCNVDELTKISPAGSTVFCQASRVGNIEILLKCLELGVDLNARDIDSSPLSQAVLGGSDEIVEIFLSLGIHSKPLKEINANQKQLNSINESNNKDENESNYKDKNETNNKNKNESNNKDKNESKNENESNNKDKNESNNKDENESNNENENNSNNKDKNESNNKDENNKQLNSSSDFNDGKNSSLSSESVIAINRIDEKEYGMFDDVIFSDVFPYFKIDLNIDFKIDKESIIFAMRAAASEGQLDCMKIFFDHGFTCDMSLLECAIIHSRYETLSYLFEKVQFEFDEKDENLISMILKLDNRTIQIKYLKRLLFCHFYVFLTHQNDINILSSVIENVHININITDNNYLQFLLVAPVDIFGFLFTHLIDKDKLTLLKIISSENLKFNLKRSIYKKEMIDFFVRYEKNNDISKLPKNVQSHFQIAKSLINKK